MRGQQRRVPLPISLITFSWPNIPLSGTHTTLWVPLFLFLGQDGREGGGDGGHAPGGQYRTVLIMKVTFLLRSAKF